VTGSPWKDPEKRGDVEKEPKESGPDGGKPWKVSHQRKRQGAKNGSHSEGEDGGKRPRWEGRALPFPPPR